MAAVVQAPVISVMSDAQVDETTAQNVEAAVRTIDHIMATVSPKPRLVVFPVLVRTGGSRHLNGVAMSSVAVELPGKAFDRIIEACRKHDCYVVSTTQEKTPKLPGLYFHTGLVLGPDGLVLRSPKAQAYSAPEVTSLRDIYEKYADVFGADAILPVAETPIGTLGCFVESEALVTEAARVMRQKGAEIIVHPTLERPDGPPWAAVKSSLAYQTGVYLLSAAVSREIRPDSSEWTGGTSTIFRPDGSLAAEIHSEGFAVASIDLDELDRMRKQQARYNEPAGVLYRHLYR